MAATELIASLLEQGSVRLSGRRTCAADLEPETRQSRQAEQEPGRAAAERVAHALLALGHLVQVALQEPLQLVEIGVGQRRDLQRRRVIVAARSAPAARSPGRRRRAPRSGRRSWRSAAPARGPPTSVSTVYWSSSGSCRSTTSHSACRSNASNQPPARAPDLDPVVQPHRQPRAQRRQPAAVAQQVLRADDRRARSRRRASRRPGGP